MLVFWYAFKSFFHFKFFFTSCEKFYIPKKVSVKVLDGKILVIFDKKDEVSEGCFIEVNCIGEVLLEHFFYSDKLSALKISYNPILSASVYICCKELVYESNTQIFNYNINAGVASFNCMKKNGSVSLLSTDITIEADSLLVQGLADMTDSIEVKAGCSSFFFKGLKISTLNITSGTMYCSFEGCVINNFNAESPCKKVTSKDSKIGESI